MAIINNFADGVLVLDKSDQILLINPKIKDLFDIKKEKIIGKSIPKLSNIKPLKPLISFFIKRKDKVFREELNIKEDLVLEISIIPMIRNKTKAGTLIILHDITREKLIEKMKSEFVSLTAHQLRTPLSTMKWIIKMILNEEAGKINDEQRDLLSDGYESNERMIFLIRDLLNVTKIEEGKYLYDLAPSDVVQIVNSAISLYKEKAFKKKIKIKFNKPTKKIPEIILDFVKIKMVIENLIDNAVRYSLSGATILISLKYANKMVKISIKDNGIGIPQKQQVRVFDKFFRGLNASKMETEGNGLGLYIAKNIIKAHGGNIWFESEVKKGTTFYFTIPIKGV